MKTLEEELLEAADAFEKVAEELDSDSKEATDGEEGKKEETDTGKEDANSESKSEGATKEDNDKKGQDAKDESKVQEIKEELGISDDLAEKVASADPSVVNLIKSMHNEIPVDSMGVVDSREKTASDVDCDPFEEFLSSPL